MTTQISPTPIRRWARRLAALVRGDGGTSAVEFALAAPVLLGLLVPMADLGMAFSQQIKVQQAAAAGAQYAALHPWNSTSADGDCQCRHRGDNPRGYRIAGAEPKLRVSEQLHRRLRHLRQHMLEWANRRVLRHRQRAIALYPAIAVFGAGQFGDPHRAIDRPDPLTWVR